MQEFKVGDIVEVVSSDSWLTLWVGQKGIITYENGNECIIKIDSRDIEINEFKHNLKLISKNLTGKRYETKSKRNPSKKCTVGKYLGDGIYEIVWEDKTKGIGKWHFNTINSSLRRIKYTVQEILDNNLIIKVTNFEELDVAARNILESYERIKHRLKEMYEKRINTDAVRGVTTTHCRPLEQEDLETGKVVDFEDVILTKGRSHLSIFRDNIFKNLFPGENDFDNSSKVLKGVVDKNGNPIIPTLNPSKEIEIENGEKEMTKIGIRNWLKEFVRNYEKMQDELDLQNERLENEIQILKQRVKDNKAMSLKYGVEIAEQKEVLEKGYDLSAVINDENETLARNMETYENFILINEIWNNTENGNRYKEVGRISDVALLRKISKKGENN